MKKFSWKEDSEDKTIEVEYTKLFVLIEISLGLIACLMTNNYVIVKWNESREVEQNFLMEYFEGVG